MLFIWLLFDEIGTARRSGGQTTGQIRASSLPKLKAKASLRFAMSGSGLEFRKRSRESCVVWTRLECHMPPSSLIEIALIRTSQRFYGTRFATNHDQTPPCSSILSRLSSDFRSVFEPLGARTARRSFWTFRHRQPDSIRNLGTDVNRAPNH